MAFLSTFLALESTTQAVSLPTLVSVPFDPVLNTSTGTGLGSTASISNAAEVTATVIVTITVNGLESSVRSCPSLSCAPSFNAGSSLMPDGAVPTISASLSSFSLIDPTTDLIPDGSAPAAVSARSKSSSQFVSTALLSTKETGNTPGLPAIVTIAGSNSSPDATLSSWSPTSLNSSFSMAATGTGAVFPTGTISGMTPTSNVISWEAAHPQKRPT